MAETRQAIDNEGEIRRLLDKWTEAVRQKDADALMTLYSRDVVAFDVLNPLQNKGSEVIRKRAEGWFSGFEGPITSELRDLKITADDNAAFCCMLNRIGGTKREGGTVDMWVRVTVGFSKINGEWLATHEHVSVPLDMETGQASVDLKP